jgi:hypothetical protein
VVIQDIDWLKGTGKERREKLGRGVTLHTLSKKVVSNELASVAASSRIGLLSMRA